MFSCKHICTASENVFGILEASKPLLKASEVSLSSLKSTPLDPQQWLKHA